MIFCCRLPHAEESACGTKSAPVPDGAVGILVVAVRKTPCPFIGNAAMSRVTVDPKQMNGVPCIRGLRIPVATVGGMIAEGMTQADILRAFPDLQAEDVHAALAYAAEAVRERQLPLLHAS